jgi:hypothetical protein
MTNLFLLSDGSILNLNRILYIRQNNENNAFVYFSNDTIDFAIISVEDYRKICEDISVSK